MRCIINRQNKTRIKPKTECLSNGFDFFDTNVYLYKENCMRK